MKAVEEIVDPATRGDPMLPLKWTSESLDKVCGDFKQQGWQVSPPTVSKILRKTLKCSLQAQKKTKEGAKQHPDRDAQFQHLSQQCKDFQQRGQPVISVDAKKGLTACPRNHASSPALDCPEAAIRVPRS